MPTLRPALCGLLLSGLAPAGLAQADESTSPAEYFASVRQADALYQGGRYVQAAELYERLLQQNPQDGRLVLRAGMAKLMGGDPAEGVPLLETAIEIGQGDRAQISYSIARVHGFLGNAEQALEWIERALAAGFENRNEIARQDNFRSLRSDSRFRALAGSLPDREFTREEGWRYDLDFVVSEVERMHAQPDSPGRTARWRAAIEELKGRVSELSDTQMAMELQVLIAALGDGHTVVYRGSTERVRMTMLPIQVYFFSDGLFVVGGTGSAAPLVGGKVTRIGGKPVDDILEELKVLVSRDNPMGIKWLGPRYIASPPALQHLGYTDRPDRARFEVVLPDGESVEVLLEGGEPYRWSKLAAPSGSEAPVPLYLQRVADNYWLREMTDQDAVYAQFNQVRDAERDPIAAFAAKLTQELERTGAKNLILDLRHNNGGNNSLIWPLIRTLVHFEMSSPDHRLFVITGRNTFSACQNFLNFIDRTTHPIIVGEPSSSKPNFTGEETEVILPYTGLNMSISTRYWQDSYPGDRRRWIAPEVPVGLSSTDYFANRDPALQAIAEIIAAGR